MPKPSGQERYRTMLRAPVYGLWSGKLNLSDFNAIMVDAVFTGLKAAWLEGAAKAGILPGELTDEELSAMQTDIFNQMQYIAGFAAFIQSHSRAAGGKLASVLPRLGMWVQRWNEFKTKGELLAGLDRKKIWTMHPVQTEHCRDCVRIAGKIKRASQFLKARWIPGSYDLSCRGGCHCTLDDTDLPISKGPLPRLSQ